MIRSKENDIEFGKQNENNVLPKLSFFGEVIPMDDPYAPFDFRTRNKKTFIELKTRNNAKDKYPTTMVSQSKVNIAKEYPKKTFIFCFNFTDGLYYIYYDKDVFDRFETSQGGRTDRGRDEFNTYCFIPVSKLLKMDL
jgi:hypothetical protein